MDVNVFCHVKEQTLAYVLRKLGADKNIGSSRTLEKADTVDRVNEYWTRDALGTYR
jgi:hypothetical protein